MERTSCLNCGISSYRERRYMIAQIGPEIIQRFHQWVPQREFSDEDFICNQCMNVLQRSLDEAESSQSRQQLGHQHVCVWCGRSILRIRSHALRENTAERILIAEIIFPRQLPDEGRVCYACWVAAKRNIQRNANLDAGRQLVDVEESGASSSAEVNIITPQPSEQSEIQQSEVETVSSQITIDAADRPAPMVLPNYKRTAATPGHCIYPNCVSEERLRVPKPMRLRLLSDFKLYVPNSARVCVEHIRLYNWEEVVQQNEFMLTFTSEQIEDMLNLLSNIRSAFKLDFENVESWSHHVCHYWLGHSPEEILQIINGCSSFRTVRNAKTIVSIYLLKLRTGDSNERLGTLLQMPVTTIGRYLKKAREILCREFVPQHLGLECLTRDNLLRKNLIIPKGLFGDDSNSKAIVIADATYVYIQKSSNYYFQKKTYSLHKYRNLIKPFLIVASNGHILDVWGPYSATISDATIMKDLFAEENGPLRRYFREGDVFILDRGFRDAMDDLVRYNYEPHKPESLEEGQTQLPTIHANKSRCVTICRWVIEVINGKFKRDYKLLRQTYFNNTCRNVMTDFRIAAALVNVFHKLITDRTDAPAILSQIRARMDVPNQLCDFIEDYNVNRRRAAFTPINGDLPQLSMFPMLTMENLILFALGTYQIKQARSYYGEHMRQNGSYSIDVCENIERIGNITDDSYFDVNDLLIRAKIQSRHHTGKTYFVYILLGQPSDTVDNPINLIKSYYCNCIVGKRTVGCPHHDSSLVFGMGTAPKCKCTSYIFGWHTHQGRYRERIK